MGLLDDAIREHLELKRRRGGDPAEIARAEQEALGPVRREPEPPAADADEHRDDLHHDEPHAAAHSEQRAAEHDFDDEPSRPPAPPEEQTRILLPDEHGHDEPPHRAAVPEQHVAAPADRLAPDDEPREQPPPVPEQHVAAPADRLPADEPEPAEPVDPRHSDIVHQPTTEFRVEDHHDDEPPAGDEDVLEETPDFLQETPEHDRLWFEQRPPRDFDFDD